MLDMFTLFEIYIPRVRRQLMTCLSPNPRESSSVMNVGKGALGEIAYRGQL